MTYRPQVILVDRKDQIIGEAEKIEAHRKGQLHRAFSVFILRRRDNQIEMLMQKRDQHKYHCGGMWTNACCSHPQPGESIVAAGQSRLQEELNINANLAHVGSFIYQAQCDNGLVEHEYDHVLIGWYQGDIINWNRQEVEAIDWVNLDSLDQWRQQHPNITPWFDQAWHIARQAIRSKEQLKT